MTRGQRLGMVVLLVAAAGAAALVYAMPYYTVSRLDTAVRDNDATALRALIDFDRLAKSMHEQVMAALAAQIQLRYGDERFRPGEAGYAFVDRMVGAMVREKLTPAGLWQVLGQQDNRHEAPAPAWMGYTAFDRFEVVYDVPDGEYRLVLARDGLLGWRLVGLRLPPCPPGYRPEPGAPPRACIVAAG